MKNSSLISNKMDGIYLIIYTNEIIDQSTFENFIRVVNNKVTLKDICFINCDLSNVDFKIITDLKNVAIVNCVINETITHLLTFYN